MAPTEPSRAAAPAALEVEETVSAVLRRQVPVRFDESPRSWLGGLPVMPAGMEWPTAVPSEHPERGRTPLHFVAQIACADLPAELWGGLGPREGWLRLFLNGEDWNVMENPDALQVLYSRELGSERQPPPGILPVHNEVYTGPDYGFVRSQADIPVLWRRWPVDLVAFPNVPIPGGGDPTITPPRFADRLYGGAPVAEDRGHPRLPDEPPFSWRGALYVIDSIARGLSGDRLGERSDKDRAVLQSQDFVAGAVRVLDEAIAAEQKRSADWRSRNVDPSDLDGQAQRDRAVATLDARRASMERSRAFLLDEADPWLQMQQSQADYRAWRSAALSRVAKLRERILQQDLDASLPRSEWAAVEGVLAGDRVDVWVMSRLHVPESVPVHREISLLTFAANGRRAALEQVAADCYVASPERRALIPSTLLGILEPYWRQLYSNRPHRMGGIHDAIQSTPTVGPTRDVLLFQITSDNAMHWVWGDAGAYYVFISAERLQAHDFTQLKSFFENH